MMEFDDRDWPAEYVEIAPDGSEIRRLNATRCGSMCRCTLPPGRVSQAVTHRTVEEIWYFLEGSGEVWRKKDGVEAVTAVRAGLSLTITTGTHFQFRNTGAGPLQFILVTMPPWPGEDEAVPVDGPWSPE